MANVAATIAQLNSARDIVLRDPAIYPQVIPGVVPIVGAAALLDLRRWGADFLAETFASPVLNAEEKQKLCIGVLDTLAGYLTRKEKLGEEEDPTVVKSAVQCAASVYPLVFRHTISTPTDTETWAKMARIKSSILKRMDISTPGVRICCVKFVARVVQVQTPGVIADPRRQEQNEISLALVPRDHPVLPPSNLEAEGSGLLDRLLGVLQDNDTDALVVTATLSALSVLVQRRATISAKILGTVLNFNPLILAERQLNGRDKVAVNSMTRTTMAFLVNVLKRNPSHAAAGRIQQTVERLRHSLHAIFSEKLGKRSAVDEPTDGLDDAKRRRIDEQVTNGTAQALQATQYPPLPPGPVTVKELFTLTQDHATTGFHAQILPQNIVCQLVPAILASIDQTKLDGAINAVRKRFLDLSQQPPASAIDAAREVIAGDEDDDYDPSATFGEYEQVVNRLDQLPDETVDEIAMGPFKLPAPPPMSEQERQEYSKTALTRVFSTLTELDQEARAKGGRRPDVTNGFARLATSGHDRDGWITLVTRIATRATVQPDGAVSVEMKPEKRTETKKEQAGFDLGTGIRKALMNYVMEDFRRRIDVAITWLNEEWYADRLAVQQRRSEKVGSLDPDDLSNYNTYTLRLLDAMTPYLDVKDGRILIRFLSEIPLVGRAVLDRVVKLAEDPERVGISTQALLYLIMFRPPAREMAIEAIESMWRNNREAKGATAKVLMRWKPSVLEEIKSET
nr:mrna cleavage and polyadenylation specificity factor complex subunit pta1 [Quercus suber]